MFPRLLHHSTRWLGGLALGAALSTATHAQEIFVPGLMKVEIFTGIDGVDINNLLNADKFINNQPDAVLYRNSFSSPDGYGDNYGARVSGFLTLTSAQAGDYEFFIRADDQAQLYISDNDNPANAQLVAQEISGCCQAFQEPGVEETTASPITLAANRRYAVYALMKEGGGGDWMQVAWRKVGDETPAANLTTLSGSMIGTMAPSGTVTITQQPQSVSTIEGVYATFTVAATFTGVVPPSFEWRKNGAVIAGATSASYTTPLLALADNGAVYTVRVFVPGQEVISANATLTVTADTVPPTITSAGGIRTQAGGIEVGVIFNESLDPASLVPANFTLSSGTVTAVRHLPNSSGTASLEDGVVLTTTGLTAGNSYQVTVTGVKDVKGNTMTATPAPFTVSTMTWAGLGTQPEAFPAAAVSVGDDGFNVNSGGLAFWSTNDDVTFVYEQINGDFDKVVRVEYQDPSSQWARTGIHARDALAGTGAEAARFQNMHANPTIQVTGAASNNSFETNRRLSIGGETSSSHGGGTPQYPNAWVRLRRAGDVMHMYRSNDGQTWLGSGYSNFNPIDGSLVDGPLPASMYVGMVYGPEGGNLAEEFRATFAARFRDYGNYTPNKSRGSQPYAIGIAFGRSEWDTRGSFMGPSEIAGINPVAQSNWNNVDGQSSEEPAALKADVNGTAQNTSATVEWTSNNLWSSTGRGEELNALTGSDRQLMVGYLDTSSASTTTVTISGIPSQLTGGNGYDVVVYALGGVANRGGGYRITDLNGTELKPVMLLAAPAAAPTAFVEAKPTDPTVHAVGNYLVFKALKANGIIVEASTDNGWGLTGTPRAPINAIQLVPTGLTDVVTTPEISIVKAASGATITYTGTLQSAPAVTGPFTDVTGATSPYTVVTSGNQQMYFRTR